MGAAVAAIGDDVAVGAANIAGVIGGTIAAITMVAIITATAAMMRAVTVGVEGIVVGNTAGVHRSFTFTFLMHAEHLIFLLCQCVSAIGSVFLLRFYDILLSLF